MLRICLFGASEESRRGEENGVGEHCVFGQTLWRGGAVVEGETDNFIGEGKSWAHL
jgi:hypothetical protein